MTRVEWKKKARLIKTYIISEITLINRPWGHSNPFFHSLPHFWFVCRSKVRRADSHRHFCKPMGHSNRGKCTCPQSHRSRKTYCCQAFWSCNHRHVRECKPFSRCYRTYSGCSNALDSHIHTDHQLRNIVRQSGKWWGIWGKEVHRFIRCTQGVILLSLCSCPEGLLRYHPHLWFPQPWYSWQHGQQFSPLQRSSPWR